MKHQKWVICFIVLLSCFIMSMIEAVIQPGYFVKSFMKMALFLGLPVLFFIFNKDHLLKQLFIFTKKSIFTALSLGISLYLLIIVGYFLLQEIVDFNQITTQLTNGIGVNASNFIFVAIYISFINSFLEEFFFRGFSFIVLTKVSTRLFAYVFSSLAFGLYHIAMMIGWFSLPIFLLSLLSLVAAGILFNWLNEKYGSIYVSWIVHLCANLGINTVGLMLFGII